MCHINIALACIPITLRIECINTYSHIMETTNQEVSKRLENSIFEKKGSKMVANTPLQLKKDPASLAESLVNTGARDENRTRTGTSPEGF